MSSISSSQIKKFLREKGLNIFACLPVEKISSEIIEGLKRQEIELEGYSSLIITGMGGKLFWDKLEEFGFKEKDPVDTYSEYCFEELFKNFMREEKQLRLFPTEKLIVPVRQLGKLCGWNNESPLKMGIHREFGLWSAFRSAYLTTAKLEEIIESESDHPCLECKDQPCVTSCLGKAVSKTEEFNFKACSDFRMKENSSCAEKCAARLACPYASEHCYSSRQIKYHSKVSMELLKLYLN